MSVFALRRKVIGASVTAGPPGPARRYERFYCSLCGGDLDVADNYCRWCGAELVTEPLSIVPKAVS